MVISLSELQVNPEKYVDIAHREDVYITRNGKRVAKLTGTTSDKIAGIKSLFGILPPDTDLDQAREERLARKGCL
jgi:prevent-host-death family protein